MISNLSSRPTAGDDSVYQHSLDIKRQIHAVCDAAHQRLRQKEQQLLGAVDDWCWQQALLAQHGADDLCASGTDENFRLVLNSHLMEEAVERFASVRSQAGVPPSLGGDADDIWLHKDSSAKPAVGSCSAPIPVARRSKPGVATSLTSSEGDEKFELLYNSEESSIEVVSTPTHWTAGRCDCPPVHPMYDIENLHFISCSSQPAAAASADDAGVAGLAAQSSSTQSGGSAGSRVSALAQSSSTQSGGSAGSRVSALVAHPLADRRDAWISADSVSAARQQGGEGAPTNAGNCGLSSAMESQSGSQQLTNLDDLDWLMDGCRSNEPCQASADCVSPEDCAALAMKKLNLNADNWKANWLSTIGDNKMAPGTADSPAAILAPFMQMSKNINWMKSSRGNFSKIDMEQHGLSVSVGQQSSIMSPFLSTALSHPWLM